MIHKDIEVLGTQVKQGLAVMLRGRADLVGKSTGKTNVNLDYQPGSRQVLAIVPTK